MDRGSAGHNRLTAAVALTLLIVAAGTGLVCASQGTTLAPDQDVRSSEERPVGDATPHFQGPAGEGEASTGETRASASTDDSELSVTFPTNRFSIREGETRPMVVRLLRPMGEGDPDRVSVDYSVETVFAEPGRDYVQTPPQTLTFVNGGPSYLLIPLETLEDDKHEGTERLILRLSNPVDVAPGPIMQAAAGIIDNDPYDPLLLDDWERYPHLWEAGENVLLGNPEIGAEDVLALPGQGAYERVLEATVPLRVEIDVRGKICGKGKGVVPVILWTTERFDATTVDHTTVTLGEAYESHRERKGGAPRRHEEDADGDGDLDLVFHFRAGETGLPCGLDVVPFSGRTYGGRVVTAGGAEGRLGRDFAIGRDWSRYKGLRFWFHGEGSGDEIAVELLDNRAPDPGPAGWELVWADEFNEPAGTPPNPAHWAYEIGDGTVNGIPGWGNAELQYYSDSTDNVATDGLGNLVITAREADGSLQCYYGSCEYTSARLISWQRAEFAYGRIESRILVPDGDRGLWPAFWGLGTNIDLVGWPQSGEIDIMEYVSRRPYEIYGTIHGPGYWGGASFGDTHVTYPERISERYRTFAIEWEPDRIAWYVDDILYHEASPGDVSPGEWVFNGPEFLILNMAVGGYFGGPVSPSTSFPQSMTIDYVRVYQGPDTAERWEASFKDDFTGWQEIEVPFSDFRVAIEQPPGAPDDGLNLDEVWGYGFRAPDTGSTSGRLLIDQVRLTDYRGRGFHIGWRSQDR
jgi:beta-glucanase (GH16 family)